MADNETAGEINPKVEPQIGQIADLDSARVLGEGKPPAKPEPIPATEPPKASSPQSKLSDDERQLSALLSDPWAAPYAAEGMAALAAAPYEAAFIKGAAHEVLHHPLRAAGTVATGVAAGIVLPEAIAAAGVAGVATAVTVGVGTAAYAGYQGIKQIGKIISAPTSEEAQKQTSALGGESVELLLGTIGGTSGAKLVSGAATVAKDLIPSVATKIGDAFGFGQPQMAVQMAGSTAGKEILPTTTITNRPAQVVTKPQDTTMLAESNNRSGGESTGRSVTQPVEAGSALNRLESYFGQGTAAVQKITEIGKQGTYLLDDLANFVAKNPESRVALVNRQVAEGAGPLQFISGRLNAIESIEKHFGIASDTTSHILRLEKQGLQLVPFARFIDQNPEVRTQLTKQLIDQGAAAERLNGLREVDALEKYFGAASPTMSRIRELYTNDNLDTSSLAHFIAGGNGRRDEYYDAEVASRVSLLQRLVEYGASAKQLSSSDNLDSLERFEEDVVGHAGRDTYADVMKRAIKLEGQGFPLHTLRIATTENDFFDDYNSSVASAVRLLNCVTQGSQLEHFDKYDMEALMHVDKFLNGDTAAMRNIINLGLEPTELESFIDKDPKAIAPFIRLLVKNEAVTKELSADVPHKTDALELMYNAQTKDPVVAHHLAQLMQDQNFDPREVIDFISSIPGGNRRDATIVRELLTAGASSDAFNRERLEGLQMLMRSYGRNLRTETTLPSDLPEQVVHSLGEIPPWKQVAAKLAWRRATDELSGLEPKGDHNPEFEKRMTEGFQRHYDELTRIGGYALRAHADKVDDVVALMQGRAIKPAHARLLRALALKWQDDMEPGFWDEDAPDNLEEMQPAENATLDILKNLNPGIVRNTLDYAVPALRDKTDIPASFALDLTFHDHNPDLAVRLASSFGNQWKDWLSLQESLGRSFHEATYWLPLESPTKLEGLGLYLTSNSTRNLAELGSVARNWQDLDEVHRGLPFDELSQYLSQTKYGSAESQAFSIEAARAGVPQSKYLVYERRFLASRDVPVPFPTDRTWESGDLTGRFLPRNDPRGVFLGEHTNCCQSPGEAGDRSAWHGQTSPKAGFFVVEDASGKIVAQSWSWISDSGGLVFDNIEAENGRRLIGDRAKDVAQIYQQAANALSETFDPITVGTGQSKLDLSPWEDAGKQALSLPSGYAGNSDAFRQKILVSRTETKPAQ